jgi:excisionase family DNA binding protein
MQDVEKGVDALMTMREVAEYAGVSYQTVRRAAAAGEPPCFRFGRQVRFTAEHVATWGQAG